MQRGVNIPVLERVSETVFAALPAVSETEPRIPFPSLWASSAPERVLSETSWVVDLESAVGMMVSILCQREIRGRKGRLHTWLNGTSSLVDTSSDVLSDLGGGGLLGVGSDLLGDLLANTFAETVRHVDGVLF